MPAMLRAVYAPRLNPKMKIYILILVNIRNPRIAIFDFLKQAISKSSTSQLLDWRPIRSNPRIIKLVLHSRDERCMEILKHSYCCWFHPTFHLRKTRLFGSSWHLVQLCMKPGIGRTHNTTIYLSRLHNLPGPTGRRCVCWYLKPRRHLLRLRRSHLKNTFEHLLHIPRHITPPTLMPCRNLIPRPLRGRRRIQSHGSRARYP